MGTLAPQKMTVDEFLAWAEGREGRWELDNGVPYRMGPDTVGHCEVRMAATTALMRGCRNAHRLCHTQPHGVGVRVSPFTMYTPDCLVYAGPKQSGDARALLDHIEEPGLEIGLLFRKVRDTVLKRTGSAQEPYVYGSLPSEGLFFKAAAR